MLDWRGDAVFAKTVEAVRRGMDGVMADCVGGAKAVHPPNVRTATYQGSIRLEPTRLVKMMLVGRWGSWNCNYAIYLEMGTSRGVPEFAVLRKTADRFYPELPARIRKEMAA